MSSAEPPAGRRPDDERAGSPAPGDERRVSREDLFGPRGPFGVGPKAAPPPGASGFEPPDDGTRQLSGQEREQATQAFAEQSHPRDDLDRDDEGDDFDAGDLGDAERTEVYRPPAPEERTQVYQQPPAAADRTQVYRPPAGEDSTQVYTPGQYQPGQYQPPSMQQSGYPGDQHPQERYAQAQYPQEQYQPGQYAGYASQETIGYPGDGGGYDGGPAGARGGGGGGGNRSWLVAALVAVVVVAAGAAAAYVLFGGGGGDPDAASRAGATTAPKASESKPSATEPEESESTEPSESESATGDTAFEAIPGEPWTDDSLDFGYLTKVSRSGDTIKLTFNRATFLTGDEAKKKNGGEAPDNDYLIEDTNKKTRTFALKDGAPLSGSTLLGGDDAGSEGREITTDELVDNAASSLSSGIGGIPVWLRHEKGQDSAVTALAEQFIP